MSLPGSQRQTVAILHYSGPPTVGGVENTIYHHARLLAQAGYAVQVIAGRGEALHPQVSFQSLAELDSCHPEVLAVNLKCSHRNLALLRKASWFSISAKKILRHE